MATGPAQTTPSHHVTFHLLYNIKFLLLAGGRGGSSSKPARSRKRSHLKPQNGCTLNHIPQKHININHINFLERPTLTDMHISLIFLILYLIRVYLEDGEHGDFLPLMLISPTRILKCSWRIVLNHWNMSDFPLLKNQQLTILY